MWENFVLSMSPKSFLHSWNWGETQKLTGKNIFRFGLYIDHKLVGVYLMILEKAKRGTHFVIPGGPLLDWDDDELVSEFMRNARMVSMKYGALFVRVRPELIDNSQNILKFRSLGFIKSPMHLHAQNTWILDITADEEKILSNMRKNTRYAIRQSMNKNLNLTISTDSLDTKILTDLQADTVRRNKFVGFSDKLFKAQLQSFGLDGQAKLFSVRRAGVPLVSAIIIFYGDSAYYHHSGSSDEARETNASYYLQWEVIRYAKKMGLSNYNFWGIAPTMDPRHRFHGVTIFKTGFGGSRVDWLPAQDMVISKLYYLTYIFEMSRKSLRRL